MFLWTFRKNEKDVINLYNTLSPVMQIATGGTMLNFGYWTSKHLDPVSAQNNLCNVFGDLAELSTAKNAIDVDISEMMIKSTTHAKNLSFHFANIIFDASELSLLLNN